MKKHLIQKPKQEIYIMMGYKRIKIFILYCLLMGICKMFANETKHNCIVYWDYDSEISIDYLNNHSFMNCKNKFPNFIIIDFSEILEFNKESQVFVLKEDFDTLKFGEQYRKSKGGKLFVSIVIDDKIVLNGVNGTVFGLLRPSDEYPEIGDCKYIIDLKSKKNIIITDKLTIDTFIRRDSLNNDLKELLYKKIELQK